jgi:hypothetical protein
MRGAVWARGGTPGERGMKALFCLLLGLSGAFWPRAADAQLLTKVGSLLSPTGGPNQSITGVGFQPKAVIFFWTAQTVGGFVTNASAGYGFATGVGSERAVGFVSDDNLAAGSNNPARWQWTNRCIAVVANAAAVATDAHASLTSMDADGFSLNWPVRNTSYIVHYLALGGPDITDAAVGTFRPAAGLGPESFGGLTFSPQFLMFLSIDSNTVGSRVTPDGKVSLGYAGLSSGYGITQGGATAVSRTGGANIVTSSMQRTDAALLEKATNVLGVELVASVTSFDANGFTIDKTVNSGALTDVHYLALRGGQYRVGDISRPSTAGPSTRAYTGVGFTPHGLLFTSFNLAFQAVPDEEARISVSAADSTLSGTPLRYGQRATFFHDKLDTPGTNDNSWVRQATSGSAGVNGKVVYLAQAGDCPPNPLFSDPPGTAQCSGGPRLISDADVVSYNRTGFTLDWTTNDLTNMNQVGGDEENAQVLYVAFGPPPPQINYRSIGTAGNVSGTLNATQGSTLVSDPSATWRTANRGVGDLITIGGTPYVVADVSSETQLTLTTSFAATTGSYAYTIARQFATLAAWEDCIDGLGNGGSCPAFAPASNDLRADHRREFGFAYDDNVGADFVLGDDFEIDDSVTDVTHTITLTADGRNRHYGIPGAGVLVDANLGPNEVLVRDSNVTVEWLELVRLRGGSSQGAVRVIGTAPSDLPQNVLLQNLLIHDLLDTTPGFDISGIRLSGDGGKSVTIRNSMIWNGDENGLEADEATDALTVENCSIDNIPDTTDSAAGGVYAGKTPDVLVKNTIVTRSGTEDYLPGTGSFSASSTNNISSDGTTPGASPLTVPPASVDALYVTPGSDLHLETGSVAIDSGVSLSGFFGDIDAGLRPAGAQWDRGADEFGATTAVELVSFDAVGADSAVDLTWRTGSELDNLGFHLYRGRSERGPWTRVTSSLIPGLGSSPEGASYSFRDVGLTNGVRYFYRLEDIDARSGSTFHGPVSAVPGAAPPAEEPGSGDSDPDGSDDGSGSEDALPGGSPDETWTYGRPADASVQVVTRSGHVVVVELQTPGFVATETPSGIRVSIPGFDQRTDPRAPDLPLKRVVLDAVVGRHARIVGVREEDTRSFPGLRPAAVGPAEVVTSPDGTVRPGRRGAVLKGDGLLPPSAARLGGDAFIGETKKIALEMSPLRYDAASHTLRLARTLRVRIAFDHRATREETGRGARGRRRPRSVEETAPRVLAYLHTVSPGLHAVSFETLFPQGREALPLDSLRLSRQGESVPFHVEPQGRTFGSGSVLFFHASTRARSTDYSPEIAYALEQAPGGVLMPSVSVSPRGARAASSVSLAEASFEENRYYQAGLLDAPDVWLWDFIVGGTSRSWPLALEGVNRSSALSARLQVCLQGASESDAKGEHHLSVSLNGIPLGEASFDGKLPHVFSASVAASHLREGENTLTVENLGDRGAFSFVFLDRADLVYPQRPSLRSGRFEGVFPEAGEAALSGVASWGLDVTDPDSPVWLTSLRVRSGSVSLAAEAGHRYVLASPEGLLSPRVSPPVPSTLRRTTNQADYVLIAPQAFLEAARPLLRLRQDQGLRTRAVSFEEIASEFGHGRPSAQAIRDFLAYAYHCWQEPSLRYVLLLGDSSYDPRDFTGFDQGSPLPAMWVKTSYLWTASDPALAAVNGEDLLPDVAIGRLPAKTLAEAHSLVEKVLAWEEGLQDLGGTAVLVADDPDLAGDFEADVLDIRASFLGGRQTKTLFLSELGRSTRDEILASFDRGASLMSYVGHGGPAVWASENVLNSWDPAKLLVQSRQPLMLTFNCLNGYFVAPNYDSLSEAFLKVEGRGTIGSFSPSGLSLEAPAHRFHRALMAEITGGEHQRLGDAVRAAQAAYAEEGLMPELLAVYHLLGDPGMTLRP